MRSAELKGRCRSATPGFGASPDIPHSAFRTPHLLAGAVTLVLLPLSAGAQQPDSTPKDTTSLPPVVVTGVRLPTVRELARGLAGRTATLDAQDLDARGVRTLADALEQLPGVTTSDELGATAEMDVSLRGFQVSPVIGVPQGVTVYVDGVRANEPDAHEVNFDLLPLEDVERVEVVYGPSVLLGRNALGAAEPGDASGHEPGVARARGVGRELRPLRAQGARGGAARRVGLLPGSALRARGGLAPGHPEPDRDAVRQDRPPERHVGRDPELLRRGQPDLPGREPPREPRGRTSRLELHAGRLFRAASAPRDRQRPAAARANPARDQRVRPLPEQ